MKGRPDKKIFIAREKGYHGSTYLAASVSGKERDRKFLDTNTEFVRFLPNVNPYIRPDGMTIEDWRDAKLADLENMILETGPIRSPHSLPSRSLLLAGSLSRRRGITRAVLISAENMMSCISPMKL